MVKTSKEARNQMALEAKAGSAGARQALCEVYAQEIERRAKLNAKNARTLDADDLAQEGYIILLEALDSWDPAKGAPFEVYLRTRSKWMVRKIVLMDAPYKVTAGVGAAVRQVRALENDGQEVDLEKIAKCHSVSVSMLNQGLALDADFAGVYQEHQNS